MLYDSTPTLKSGILYLDGEGTASAYIARRGADIYLSGEFNTVVFAGSRVPAKDWKSKFVFPLLEKDGLPIPSSIETEAEYMARIFADTVGSKPMNSLTSDAVKVFKLVEGTNTGEKIRNSQRILEDFREPIQAVTLVYGQRRIHGTLRVHLGDAPVISVDGVYPLGITKENWDKWFLAYATVMDEADKTGPRFDGKSPAYSKFFDEIDIAAERKQIFGCNHG